MADIRKSCMQVATTAAEKQQCVEDGRDDLKKSLAEALGEDEADLTAEDVEAVIEEGAAKAASEVAAACMEEGEEKCDEKAGEEAALTLGLEPPSHGDRRLATGTTSHEQGSRSGKALGRFRTVCP